YIYVGMAAGFAFVVQPAYTAGIRRTVAEAFHFPGDNMDPTILRGDYLLAVPRLWRKLDQGDVVVIRMDDGRRVIRRIVGLPGDTLEMRAKVLMVNGDRQTESYVRHIDPNGDPSLADFLWQREFLADGDPEEADYAPSRDHWGPLVVPEDHYFL